MAIFQHNNRSIHYSVDVAPFKHDLLLLQPSRLTPEFWQPLRESLKEDTPAGGRTLVCDWFSPSLTIEEMAEDLFDLLKTVGFHSVQVVAYEDAVTVIQQLQKKHGDILAKTLLKDKMPSVGDSTQAIRDFSQI